MRLAITGSAMVTSVGAGKHQSFQAFTEGVSGRKPLQAFAPERFNVQYAYEIADRPGPDGARIDEPLRATRWVCQAIVEAVREAELTEQDEFCVIVGTGLRELRSLEQFWVDGRALPLQALHFEEAVQAALGFPVPVITLCNACSASNFALSLAEDLIHGGKYRTVVAAGCDSISESMFGLLDRVNPTPPDRVQPFERDRKGVLMGEGAAAVVVENPSNSVGRGIRTKAWLRGVGTSCDAGHETAPDVGGITRAVTNAHQRAKIAAHEVDVVFVHGTGTHLNDATEAAALRQVFGDAVRSVPISGLKSMTGHTSGASGLVGVVTAIESLRSGVIPPTVGFSNPMAEAEDMLVVHDRPVRQSLNFAQVNAFGFGGVNAVAIIEKAQA
ncbi:MAG: beta-ketoacyl synthase N-terminal-like domain-containing protein [Gammaproteobacteria bacterium]